MTNLLWEDDVERKTIVNWENCVEKWRLGAGNYN